jgi:hypothetical protein
MKNRNHSPSGVALIIVLGFLVIISALAVAFFTSITTENKASRNFAAGITTQQLADSAVQIVIGQIADATTRGINPGGAGTEAWASQPGMIRVFDSFGQPDAYYLLYSSDDMLKTAGTIGSYDPTKDYSTTWDQSPAVYTDLNDPVMVYDSMANTEVPRFPIIDPRAWSDSGVGSPWPNPTSTFNQAWAHNTVEGFWYDTSVQMHGMVGYTDSAHANNQRLPMPVKWIYVLQDGTLTSPSPGSAGGKITFNYNDNRQPTKANPIVGRIAFWTDDETCKLNLNTAAGFVNSPSQIPSGYTANSYAGSYWDTPRFYTNFDYGQPYYNFVPALSGPPQAPGAAGAFNGPGTPIISSVPDAGGGGLALCQLLQNEFQRYPGHPGTTSLAPVFSSLLTGTGVTMSSEQMYGLTPRYSNFNINLTTASDTAGGTKRIIVGSTTTLAGGVNAGGTTGTGSGISTQAQQLQPKTDRLYATVDELFFGAHNVALAGGTGAIGGSGINSGTVSYTRIVNDAYTDPQLNGNGGSTTQASVLTPQVIDTLRFFLTTQSRAPDLNLWGMPRVTTWPVRAEDSGKQDTYSGLNVFDNLILFCSTIGPNSSTAAAGTTFRPDTSDNTVGVDSSSNGQFRYIFTRREVNNTSPIPVPGTLASASYPQQTCPNVTAPLMQDCERSRNKYLLSTYLGNFLSGGFGNIPGFGASWSKKFSPGDQETLLLQIFDYIRCANSQDTTTSLSSGKPVQFAPHGYVAPSVPQSYFTGAKAGGRMSTICEATMDFYYAGPVMNNTGSAITVDGVKVTNTGSSKWDPLTPNARYVKEVPWPTGQTTTNVSQNQMRAFVVFSTFDPMQGYPPKFDPVNAGVNGLNNYNSLIPVPASPQMTIAATFSANVGDWVIKFIDQSGNLQSTPFQMTWLQGPVSTNVNRAPGAYWGGRNYGGYEGFMHTLLGPGSSSNFPGRSKIMPFPNVFLYPGTAGAPAGTPPDVGITNYPSTTPNGSQYVPGFNPALTATWAPAANASTANPFTLVAADAQHQEFYPFQTTNAIQVPVGSRMFTFGGGTVNLTIFYGGVQQQTMTLTFPPSGSQGWPVPQGGVGSMPGYVGGVAAGSGLLQPLDSKTGNYVAGSTDVTTWEACADPTSLGQLPVSATAAEGLAQWYWTAEGCFYNPNIARRKSNNHWAHMTSMQASWSLGTRLSWVEGVRMGETVNSSTGTVTAGVVNNGVVTWPTGAGTSGADEFGNSNQPSWADTGHTNQIEYNGVTSGSGELGSRWQCIVQPGDTVRSLLYWDGGPGGPSPAGIGLQQTKSGDLRVGQVQSTVPAANFTAHPDYQTRYSRACVMRGGDGAFYFANAPAVVYANSTTHSLSQEASLGNQVYLGKSGNKVDSAVAFANLPWSAQPTGSYNVGTFVNGVERLDGAPGDWDNGAGSFPDGPFLNKQDEGNVIYRYWDGLDQIWVYPIPYFTQTFSYQQPGDTFTSPARQMPSPAMIGSIPAHPIGLGSISVPQPHPWETLCFCPNTAGLAHPGNVDPKDHLLLDLFSMPVVEPYPISEPFSTAGRVNLNYHIAPFDYITRSTALRGALYSTRVTAVDSQYTLTNSGTTYPNYAYYKSGQPPVAGAPTPQGYSGPARVPLTENFRYLVDRDQTIKEMDAVYYNGGQNNGFFKAASQICEQFLVPWEQTNTKTMETPTGGTAIANNAATMQNWWSSPLQTSASPAKADLTGDNEREKPYVDLYPRVTTKSNTYTVHMKVQVLRQIPRDPTAPTAYANWSEGQDVVLAEYRGSATIERYIDPADPRIGVGAYNGAAQTNPDTQSLEPLYRFRTITTKKFSPGG